MIAIKASDKLRLGYGLDYALFLMTLISLFWWLTGQGLFYTEVGPVMSPFTSLSLLGMVGVRLASKKLIGWGHAMSLAVLGIVSCGNASNILMLMLAPSLVLDTLPGIVPTSILTSIGIILFCFYEILLLIRPTRRSFFIVDDILLHLALFPGGVSLLGHLLGAPAYLSSSVDPRVGICKLEMAFMGVFALSSVLTNKDLFLWKFLEKNNTNKLIFAGLFLNQYIVPVLVGLLTLGTEPPSGIGIEFFVMLAGVLATLLFLSLTAAYAMRQSTR